MLNLSDETLKKIHDELTVNTFRDQVLVQLIDEVIEWRRLAKERDTENEKYAQQSMDLIRSDLRRKLFADLTDKQRRELDCHYVLGTPIPNLANTAYSTKNSNGEWVTNVKAREDYDQLQWAGLRINRDGKIVTLDEYQRVSWGEVQSDGN